MPDVTRTFIGLALPQQLRLKLSRLAQNLGRVAPKARWLHQDDFHITLAFLGDVPHVDIRDVCTAVDKAAAGAGSIALSLQGIGAFPDLEKPRVIWAGVGGDLEGLVTLRKNVVEAVARVGYPPDDDRFHPHITLGRLKPGKGAPPVDLQAQEAHLRTWTAGPWTVDAIITYGSHPVDDGPSYTTLGTSRISRKNSSGID